MMSIIETIFFINNKPFIRRYIANIAPTTFNRLKYINIKVIPVTKSNNPNNLIIQK